MKEGKEQAEELLNVSIGFAEEMLKKNGEFFPFGSAMKPNNKIAAVAGYTGSEHPPSQKIFELLRSCFAEAAKQKEYIATAIVYDVRVPSPKTGIKSDAICFEIDHQCGYSVVVFKPYRLTGRKIEYEEVFAQAGTKSIFK